MTNDGKPPKRLRKRHQHFKERYEQLAEIHDAPQLIGETRAILAEFAAERKARKKFGRRPGGGT